MSIITCIGKSRRALGLCLFFLLPAFFSLPLFAQSLVQPSSDEDFDRRTDELLAKAASLQLAQSRQWQGLLLYTKTLSGYRSIISAPEFFLAADGKSDPAAELEADIRSFRQGKAVDRFPARWKYLQSLLAEKEGDFPQEFDQPYKDFKAQIQPTAAMFVYPAGFMQNPASMFGHTFLVFENAKKSRLLAQSVTFSANNTDRPGLLFALKGLFGLYRGYFTIDSYAKQILKYSNMDKRDIWEYKLRLTEDELDLLYRHSLELNLMYTNYYYVSRNCTSGGMMLLQAVFPQEDLLAALGAMAEPVEAIKILQEKNLLETPVFRPSIHTQLLSEKNALSAASAKAVKAYCRGKLSLEALLESAAGDDEKTRQLTLAADYLKYLLSASKITQKEYQARLMSVLRAMSHYTFASQNPLSSNDYPHESHDSHKIALSAVGRKSDSSEKGFGRIAFRLVNHDLIDDDHGMNKNTQLNLLSGALAWYPSEDGLSQTLKVERLTFADIFSIPACDSYFVTSSMAALIGFERVAFSSESDALALRLKFFKGLSCKLGEPCQLYLLAGLDSYLHPDFDLGFDPLLGLESGFIVGAGPWKQHLQAQLEQGLLKNDGEGTAGTWKQALVDGDSLQSGRRLHLNLSLENRLTLSRNTALSAKYTFARDYKSNSHTGEVTMHVNF